MIIRAAAKLKKRKLKKEKKKGRPHRRCSIFSSFPGISRSIHHLFFFFLFKKLLPFPPSTGSPPSSPSPQPQRQGSSAGPRHAAAFPQHRGRGDGRAGTLPPRAQTPPKAEGARAGRAQGSSPRSSRLTCCLVIAPLWAVVGWRLAWALPAGHP